MTTVVVDSRRAWATVVGAFVSNFIIGGLGKSYGIILEHYQHEFDAPTAYFTLTGGILYMLMFVLSLPNHFLVQRIGHRAVVMVGGIGGCISLLVAASAPTVTVWAIAVGGGIGFSFACVYFNIFSVVGQCFRKRLGIANGLSVAGVSVGQMAFPSLVTHLLEVYGVRAGTVIMAAFLLHICVTAVLMPTRVVESEEELISPSSKDLSTTSPISSSDELEVDGFGDSMDRQKLQHLDYENIELTTSSRDSDLPKIEITRSNRQEKLVTALLVIYVMGKVFADNGDVGISLIAPPYGTQMGFSSSTTSKAIAVAGVVDLISRLGFGWLTDQPFCVGKRGYFLAVTWMVEAANAVAFGQLTGVSWSTAATTQRSAQFNGDPSQATTVGYYLCFAIHGVCSGTAMTQMVVVLSDWVGPDRLAKSLAIMMVVLGLTYVPAQTATGYLNDILGTYAWSMRLCGLWLAIASLIFLLEYPIQRFLSSRSWFSKRSSGVVEIVQQKSPHHTTAFGDEKNQNNGARQLSFVMNESMVPFMDSDIWATSVSSSPTISPTV